MAERFVKSRICYGKITLFVASGCMYCVNAVELVKTVAPERLQVFDIIRFQDIQDYLRQTTGRRNVPYVFIGTTFIGGLSELQRMYYHIPRML